MNVSPAVTIVVGEQPHGLCFPRPLIPQPVSVTSAAPVFWISRNSRSSLPPSGKYMTSVIFIRGCVVIAALKVLRYEMRKSRWHPSCCFTTGMFLAMSSRHPGTLLGNRPQRARSSSSSCVRYAAMASIRGSWNFSWRMSRDESGTRAGRTRPARRKS
jgi:hypothetical protein